MDSFGIGEHHRKEYPIRHRRSFSERRRQELAAFGSRIAAGALVLSAADPVRVFQNFATLDLLSKGRAEMVVGRGSFIEAFPLFGLDSKDYDALFAEKLESALEDS